MQVTAPIALAVEDTLDVLYRRQCADLRHELTVIGELDRSEAYLVDGALSMVDWLCYKRGESERTARTKTKAARALEFLPAIGDALESGVLSWDKVRWLVEFATPDEDIELADLAIGMSYAQVRAMAIHRRRLSRELADKRFQRRYLKIVPDVEEGVVRIWGRLRDVEGMAVKTAIDRIADQQPTDPITDRLVPYEQRCADALVQVCGAAAAADGDPDRATIVCHVDADALASEDGVATIDGMPIAAESMRRLMCDGRVQTMLHAHDGTPIGVGRVTRVVPQYLRRQLLKRDDGCVWPGCTNHKWLHAHHVIHVAHGGETNFDNLVMLCPGHHDHIHENGWSMRGRPGLDLRILRPDGTPLARSP